MNTRFKGLIYGAVAAMTYGLNPLFALPLYRAGLSVDSVLFYRYYLSVAMLSVLMIVRKQSFALNKKEFQLLLLIGFLFSGSSFCLFDSYNYMDAGIASTILFLYPILVALIMAVCYHERISRSTVFSILLAFVGIALLYKGEDGQTLNWYGVFLVFLSALFYAICMVGINRSALRIMPTVKLTFYSLLFGGLLFLIRLRGGVYLQMLPSSYYLIHIILIALLPTIVSLVTMTLAIHYIGSTITAILGALEPLTALVIGVLVFDEQMSWRIAWGILLILSAVTIIVLFKNNSGNE